MIYICNRKRFTSLDQARAYANAYFTKTGVILGIEGVTK